jgi:hypothetical protein
VINGLTASIEKRKLWVQSSASGTTGGDVGTGATYSHTATLASYYTPDAVYMNAALSLVVSSSSAGSGSWSVVYTGPGAPTGYTASGTGYDASLKAELVFETITLYGTFYTKWRTVVSAIKLYIDGTLDHTFTGFDHTTDAFGPSWLDLWGCFAQMSGSCSATRTGLPGTMPDEYEYWAQNDQTITGMWEDYIDGSWVAHPVSLVSDSVPSTGGTCPYGLSLGIVSGDAQNNLSISQKAYTHITKSFHSTVTVTDCINEYWGFDDVEEVEYLIKSCHGTLSPSLSTDFYQIETETESRTGSVWCIPNLPCTIERFNTDFSELIQRLGLPKTTKLLAHSCTTDGVTTSASNESEVHPRHTSMLSTVGPTAHTIEDPLAETVYAPMVESASHSKTYTFDSESNSTAVTCISDPGCAPASWFELRTYFDLPAEPVVDPDSETASCTFPYDVDDSTDNSYISCYLNHAVPTARYVNFWASRNWLYWPYFPQEKDPEEDELEANDWPVDSALVSTQEYWLNARTQWIHNTALPSGEDSHIRNSLVSFCGYQSGHGPFFAAYVHGSVESSWLGISRWVTQELDLPTSMQYTSASSPLWTLTGCTGAHGTDLVLTPSAGTAKAKIRLGSWSQDLFMYPHIAHQVKVNWSTTNVTAVRAYLCSIDGSSRTLLENTPGDGFTTRNVVYDIPHGTDAKYTGSHAQDMGCGIVTDTGTDLKPTGISAATMADAERAMAYMLGGSGTWQYLEFEIDCTGPVTLNYPTFYASKTGWTVICENGHYQTLIRPDGPGIRIGPIDWSSGNSLITPPAVKDFPDKMSVIDWLCTKRALCGLDPHTGVTTEMASLYDSYEGQSVQNGSATCYAFLLPIGEGGTVRAALVNTYSEAPPLPHFPRMERDPVTWLETGDYGLYAYEQAQGPRYLVNGGPNYLDLNVGGTVWTAPSAISIGGWKISEHSHAVDNTETGAKIIGGTTEIAEVRPWWGWLFVFVEILAEGGDVANIHAALNMFMRAVANADGVAVKSSKHGSPSAGWWKNSTPITDAMSHVCLVPEGRDNSVLLLASDETTCIRKRTFDLGATWTTETAMTGTLYERGDESPMLFSTILGVVESTMKLKGQIRGPSDSSYGTEFTVKDDAAADLVLEETAFDVHYSEDDEALILSCKASGETEFGEWASWDHGKTFKKL